MQVISPVGAGIPAAQCVTAATSSDTRDRSPGPGSTSAIFAATRSPPPSRCGREAGLTRPWNDPNADIALALATPSSTVLAGRIDGRLVATAMVGSDGHRGWVYYLAVARRAAAARASARR